MNVVRYRYRLRPGAIAMVALLVEWDRCRWVWNRAVERLNETGEWVCDACDQSIEIRVLAEPEIPAL